MSTPPPTAIDYHVRYPCPIKRRLSLTELSPVLLDAGGPEGVLARFLEPGDRDAVDPLRRWLPGVSAEPFEVAPAEAVRRAELAIRFRKGCRDCPANLDSERAGYGCFGSVPLPIGSHTEEAMILVILRIMEGGEDIDASASHLVRFVWDNGLDGGAVQGLRGESMLLERVEAATARVGPFLGKRKISSDQILDVLFGSQTLQPAFLLLFRSFSSEFMRLCGEMGAQAAAAGPLIRFLRSAVLAAELGVGLELTALCPPGSASVEVNEGDDVR